MGNIAIVDDNEDVHRKEMEVPEGVSSKEESSHGSGGHHCIVRQ